MLSRSTTLGALLLCSGTAYGQNHRMTPMVGPELSLGVGGQVDVSFLGLTASADLRPTLGGGLRVSVPLHQYFAADARIAAYSWSAKDSDGRNLLVDIGVIPRARLTPVEGLEAYAGFPVGLSVSRLASGANGGDSDGSIGVHIGLLGGAQVRLNESLSAMAEVGYLRHGATHTLAFFEVDANVGQATMSVAMLIHL